MTTSTGPTSTGPTSTAPTGTGPTSAVPASAAPTSVGSRQAGGRSVRSRAVTAHAPAGAVTSHPSGTTDAAWSRRPLGPATAAAVVDGSVGGRGVPEPRAPRTARSTWSPVTDADGRPVATRARADAVFADAVLADGVAREGVRRHRGRRVALVVVLVLAGGAVYGLTGARSEAVVGWLGGPTTASDEAPVGPQPRAGGGVPAQGCPEPNDEGCDGGATAEGPGAAAGEGRAETRDDAYVVAVADALAATGLDPTLARRVARAQAAAEADGVVLTVTSGKRTVQEQEGLVAAAIKRYGSKREASRWVLPPESSAHVTGLAVDIGPTEGALWLGEHALDFGLCRTYANEVWHFEPLPKGATTCAPMLPDSSSGW